MRWKPLALAQRPRSQSVPTQNTALVRTTTTSLHRSGVNDTLPQYRTTRMAPLVQTKCPCRLQILGLLPVRRSRFCVRRLDGLERELVRLTVFRRFAGTPLACEGAPHLSLHALVFSRASHPSRKLNLQLLCELKWPALGNHSILDSFFSDVVGKLSNFSYLLNNETALQIRRATMPVQACVRDGQRHVENSSKSGARSINNGSNIS